MRLHLHLLLVGPFSLLLACGSGDSGDLNGIAQGSGATGSGGKGTIIIPTGGGNTGSGGAGSGIWSLPQGFTKATMGGWQLGEELTGEPMPMGGSGGGSAGGNGTGCGALLGVVRDFNGAADPMGHPDFETFSGSQETLGMVQPALAADLKPAYTGVCEAAGVTGPCPYNQQSTSAAAFNQWYRADPAVNRPFLLRLSFQPDGTGLFTFASNMFFPLDGAGFGNQGRDHNFHFTTEVHTEFIYRGGETFQFTGDDDLWVFINKKLAIDLGGLHPARDSLIDLDMRAAELGITTGQFYTLDLFHAERHTNESNFRVDTTLEFTNCGIFVPDNPR